MEFLSVEHALISAVKEQRDFYQSAGWIQSIIMKLNITEAERETFINDLVELLSTYPKGKNKA